VTFAETFQTSPPTLGTLQLPRQVELQIFARDPDDTMSDVLITGGDADISSGSSSSPSAGNDDAWQLQVTTPPQGKPYWYLPWTQSMTSPPFPNAPSGPVVFDPMTPDDFWYEDIGVAGPGSSPSPPGLGSVHGVRIIPRGACSQSIYLAATQPSTPSLPGLFTEIGQGLTSAYLSNACGAGSGTTGSVDYLDLVSLLWHDPKLLSNTDTEDNISAGVYGGFALGGQVTVNDNGIGYHLLASCSALFTYRYRFVLDSDGVLDVQADSTTNPSAPDTDTCGTSPSPCNPYHRLVKSLGSTGNTIGNPLCDGNGGPTGLINQLRASLDTTLPTTFHQQLTNLQSTAAAFTKPCQSDSDCPYNPEQAHGTCDVNTHYCDYSGSDCDPGGMTTIPCTVNANCTSHKPQPLTGPCVNNPNGTGKVCVDTAGSGCALSNFAGIFKGAISTGERMLDIVDNQQAIPNLLDDEKNWVCVPKVNGASTDPCNVDARAGTCSIRLRAKRINVSSETVDLVWFDEPPLTQKAGNGPWHVNNITSADTAFATLLALLGSNTTGTSPDISSLCQSTLNTPLGNLVRYQSVYHADGTGTCPYGNNGSPTGPAPPPPVCPCSTSNPPCACGVACEDGQCPICHQDSDCVNALPGNYVSCMYGLYGNSGDVRCANNRCVSNAICNPLVCGSSCPFPYETCVGTTCQASACF
jgi:hypothetical protein